MANCKIELNSRCLVWHRKNRSHLEIMASMLEAVKDDGASRYSIMKHVHTNYVKIKEYLESLIEMGFIETDINDEDVFYRASEKGIDFLEQYYALLECF